MADLSKATPRPWAVGEHDPRYIYGPTKAAVAGFVGWGDVHERTANAALVVKAVNEREELLAALRIIAGGDGDAQIIARQTLIKVGDKG